MENKSVVLEINNQTAWVYINRPKKLNALNKEVIAALSDTFDQIAQLEEVRTVVLTGVGDKAFVAGADIAEFAHFSKEEAASLARNGQHVLFDKVANFDKPVIALINGYALGGGLELALAAHMRIAYPHAKMGLPEVSLGVIPGYGGTQRLTRLVGEGRAVEMICSAQMVDAAKAEQIGLVNVVVNPDKANEQVERLTEKHL